MLVPTLEHGNEKYHPSVRLRLPFGGAGAVIGLSDYKIGLLLSLTLLGDVAVSLWVTTSADRIGRKALLIFGSVLMAGAGLVFLFTKNPLVLTIAAIIGIISPSGNEIGPFLSIEQASLTQLIPDEKRTAVFG